jgi:hypothetical protein
MCLAWLAKQPKPMKAVQRPDVPRPASASTDRVLVDAEPGPIQEDASPAAKKRKTKKEPVQKEIILTHAVATEPIQFTLQLGASSLDFVFLKPYLEPNVIVPEGARLNKELSRANFPWSQAQDDLLLKAKKASQRKTFACF